MQSLSTDAFAICRRGRCSGEVMRCFCHFVISLVTLACLSTVWSCSDSPRARSDSGPDLSDVSSGDVDTGPNDDRCGNEVIDESEACDGSSLGGKTCGDFGYPDGHLRCNARCRGFLVGGCEGRPDWTRAGRDNCRACPANAIRHRRTCRRLYCDTPADTRPPDTPIVETLDVQPVRTLTVRLEAPEGVDPQAHPFSDKISVEGARSRVKGPVDELETIKGPLPQTVQFELPAKRFDLQLRVRPGRSEPNPDSSHWHRATYTLRRDLQLDRDRTLTFVVPATAHLTGRASIDGLPTDRVAVRLTREAPATDSHGDITGASGHTNPFEFSLPYVPGRNYVARLWPDPPGANYDWFLMRDQTAGPVVYRGPLPPPGGVPVDWTFKGGVLQADMTLNGSPLPADARATVQVVDLKTGQTEAHTFGDSSFRWALRQRRYRLKVTLEQSGPKHFRTSIERIVDVDGPTDLGACCAL